MTEKRVNKQEKSGGSSTTHGLEGDVRLWLLDFGPDHVDQHEVSDLNQAFELRDTSSVTWLDVSGGTDRTVLQKIADEFGIHALVVKDILNVKQRPRIEFFPDYIFMVMKSARFDGKTLYLRHVSLVIAKNYILTFQEGDRDLFEPLRERIVNAKGRLQEPGPDYLAYAAMDMVVDNYYTVLEQMDDAVAVCEDRAVSSPDQKLVNDIHVIRRNLIRVKRAIWPLREELSVLEHEQHTLIQPETAPYLRDLYDHVLGAVEYVESLRDTASGLMDMYLSSASTRMNEVMMVLTLIATLFIPLSFIADIYSITFVPELKWHLGYLFVWVLMLGIAGIMIAYFKKKKWI